MPVHTLSPRFCSEIGATPQKSLPTTRKFPVNDLRKHYAVDRGVFVEDRDVDHLHQMELKLEEGKPLAPRRDGQSITTTGVLPFLTLFVARTSPVRVQIQRTH